MERIQTDTVVIGAGVIGLAAARALALSGREVLVLEANSAVGMEISSRNSEVIHAGLHYQPGSLKAATCLRGKALLYEYCGRKGIAHRRIGKLIVANGPEQAAALERIRDNAAECGVIDLQWLNTRQLKLKEPAVRADAALWSPSTGIISSHDLMLSLQADLEAAGGVVVFKTPVVSGERAASGLSLTTGGADAVGVSARTVVNAAGLQSTDFASRMQGLAADSIPEIRLVRGHYFTYAGKSPLSHLVYPLPEQGGLGIHGTLDLAGQLRFGPDSEPVDTIDYAFDESRRPAFVRSIQKWLPGLDVDDLNPGYTGIRPR
ncbi:MAG: FAD-dependent oxidoreductase, partial [Thiohalobacterales bacterium]|nr:FAD-dependent oxidoreductase [Thiohalobacterales bacterium]